MEGLPFPHVPLTVDETGPLEEPSSVPLRVDEALYHNLLLQPILLLDAEMLSRRATMPISMQKFKVRVRHYYVSPKI